MYEFFICVNLVIASLFLFFSFCLVTYWIKYPGSRLTERIVGFLPEFLGTELDYDESDYVFLFALFPVCAIFALLSYISYMIIIMCILLKFVTNKIIKIMEHIDKFLEKQENQDED